MSAKPWDIWCAGHHVTGSRMPPHLLGSANGETFRAACLAFHAKNPEVFTDTRGDHFNAERLAFWGCKLCPTEAEALLHSPLPLKAELSPRMIAKAMK